MAFDLQRARQETPGCERVLHFNNAGSSLMPESVLEAQMGGYEAAEQADEAIEHVYDAAARLINCSRDEINRSASTSADLSCIIFLATNR
jgi:selenocysteine lyase/cysteine desulfurase